jgi:hypothetical protein
VLEHPTLPVPHEALGPFTRETAVDRYLHLIENT